MTEVERKLLEAIAHGRARCGAGFGKYPLGVLYVVELLLPQADTPAVRERLLDFKKRLES